MIYLLVKLTLLNLRGELSDFPFGATFGKKNETMPNRIEAEDAI